MQQLTLDIVAPPEHSFENFVPGDNADALAHLPGVPGQPVPVYLWGPPGSGKTHLLQALAAQVQAAGGRVAWFDADRTLPWTFTDGLSLIVLDDCEAYDAARQQAAFALFVEATTRALPVAAAGRQPPVDLPLRDDLRTRLGWGPVFALSPLSDAQARAALRREADRRGLFLSDDVMDYLLNRFSRDMKHLMRLLDRIDAYALAAKRAVTLPLLRQMLAQEGQS